MKYFFIFLFFLIGINIAFASDNEAILDSITRNKNQKEKFEVIKSEIHKYNTDNLLSRLFFSRALLEVAKETEDSTLLARAWYEMGYSYEIIGQLDLGIEACFKALKYYEKTDEQKRVGLVYNEIGLIYSSSNNEDELLKSIEYFNKFLGLQKELKDTAEIAGAYSNIGLIYIYMKNGDSAYYYSKRALDLRRKINQERTIPISLGNVGISLYYLGKKDSAMMYYKESVVLYKKMNNFYGLNESYRDIITFYLDENNVKEAKIYVDKYWTNSRKINSQIITKNAYFIKYQYFKATNDYKSALKYYENYKEILDSINSDKIKNRIANLESIYRLNQREKEIALYKEKEKLRDEEEKNRKQKSNFLLLASALIVITLLVISRSFYRKSQHQKKLLILETEAHEKEKALAKSELEKSKIKEQELNTKLEYKSKQLTSHALNMMKKNQFLQELEGDVAEISKNSGDEVKNKLRNLNRSIKRMNKSDKDWELFKNYFEEVNTGFYQRLGERFDKLSSNDYKLLALIKLNMNIKETASVLNISPDSVKTARYRLRKKLEMKQEDDLYEFVSGI